MGLLAAHLAVSLGLWCAPASPLAPSVHHLAAPRALVATFSIVTRAPANGDLGVAVQSKFPNVRVAVSYAKAGVGAVAMQSFSNSDFGANGLELGASPDEALTIIGRDGPDLEDRQVGPVDAKYLQRLPSRKGFLEGRSDCVWDQASTEASADSMGSKNYDTRIRHAGKIDRKILERIRRKEGPMR